MLLVAAPILAWTRFAIASGAIPADILTTLSAHFSAHLLADGTHMAMSPTLFSIDQLPRSHVETYAKVHKLAQAALKGTVLKADTKVPETAPFLADTRYPAGGRGGAGRRPAVPLADAGQPGQLRHRAHPTRWSSGARR